ncbi:MAG: SH3 domain-containing protein [Aggregatilineales bacterium]
MLNWKRTLRLTILSLLCVIMMIPAGIQAQDITVFGTIDAPATGINARFGPGTKYYVAQRLNDGERVIVYGTNLDNSWLQVATVGDVRAWVLATSVVVEGSLAGVPMTAATGINSAYVDTSALNLRAGPDVTFEIITTLPGATALNMVARSTDSVWAYVEVAGGFTGWVNVQFIAPSTLIGNLPARNTLDLKPGYTLGDAPRGVPTAIFRLVIRTGPGRNFDDLGRLLPGRTVDLIGRDPSGVWLQVRTAEGLEGWVSAFYIATNYTIADLPVPPPSGQ